MKTFKHTFEDSQLVLIDGEVQEVDPVKYEATFSLTTASLLMFEEEYGQPLMSAMTTLIPASALKGNEDTDFTTDEILKFLNTRFIRALACSTYLKIDNGKIYNNLTSKNEFKESPMNELCLTDFDFIQNIMSLATQCLYSGNAKNTSNTPSKKK